MIQKVRFVRDYEAKTNTGTRHIKAGTVLELSQEKAQRLIDNGFAEAVTEGLIIKWETAGGRIVFLTDSPEVKAKHEREGEAWFTYDELKAMSGISREEVEQVITVKEIFKGADVEGHIRKGVKKDEERQGKMGF